MHSTTSLAVTEPGGLFLAFSNAYEGRMNDQLVANLCHLSHSLNGANLRAMADKGFTSTPWLAASPKINQDHDLVEHELKFLNTIRTAGCEWPFGNMKTAFPNVVLKWRQKNFATTPTVWGLLAALVSNLVRMEVGCNNNKFFDLLPFTSVEEYLSGN
jgi:hypothetical protein